MTKYLLKCEVGFVLKQSAVNVQTMQAESHMKPLNTYNWQSIVYHFPFKSSTESFPNDLLQITVKALPDYEGIVIGFGFHAIKKNPKQELYHNDEGHLIQKGQTKKQKLPSIGITVNYYSCLIQSKNNELKLVMKAATNNRENRMRPEEHHKDQAIIIQQPADGEKYGFAKEVGEYGRYYAREYLGDKFSLPSLS